MSATQKELVEAYEEIQKLKAIWPAMPYTALSCFQRGMSQSEMLLTLKTIILEHNERQTATEKKLHELENDVAAFRRIIWGDR